MATDYDLIVVKGDTARWQSYIYGSTGAAFDFRGCTVYMEIRNGYYPATSVASYVKYIENNATLAYPQGLTGGISAATGGTLYLCLGSSYSSSLSTDRTCKYDVRVYSPTLKDLTTILKGNIQVLPEVTDT
jgi:hypothetical protein